MTGIHQGASGGRVSASSTPVTSALPSFSVAPAGPPAQGEHAGFGGDGRQGSEQAIDEDARSEHPGGAGDAGREREQDAAHHGGHAVPQTEVRRTVVVKCHGGSMFRWLIFL